MPETKDQSDIDAKYLEHLLRHMENVRENCIVVGKHLIENGEVALGRSVIRNGICHDVSKLDGVEWDIRLFECKKQTKEQKHDLERAIGHHVSTNEHHPEFWNGIQNMPEVHVIEMVCDWRSRATEFGTDLRDWIESEATKRYKFDKNDKVYDLIYKYVNILLAPIFKKKK